MQSIRWFQAAKKFFQKFLQKSGLVVEIRPPTNISTSPSFFKFNSHRNFTHQHDKKDPTNLNPVVKQYEVITNDFVDLLDTRIDEWIREGNKESAMNVFRFIASDSGDVAREFPILMNTPGNELEKARQDIANSPVKLKPSTRSFNSILKLLIADKKYNQIAEHLHLMKRSGRDWNASTYLIIMKTLLEWKHFSKVQVFFEKMKKQGISPSAQHYNILIASFAKELVGLEEVIEPLPSIFEELAEDQNIYLLNTPISAAPKKDPNVQTFVEKIDSILLEMKKKAVVPLESIFIHVMWAFAKIGDLTLMEKYYHSLKKDIRCTADVFTTMIHGYKQKNQYAKAKECWNHMLSLGIKPDASTYNAYLDILGENDVPQMMTIYNSARNFLIGEVDSTTTVLKHLSKQGISTMLDFARERISEGTEPDTVMYTMLLDQVGKSGDTGLIIHLSHSLQKAKMLKLFEELILLGLKPDVVVYTAMIRRLIEKKEISKVDKYFAEMQKFKVPIKFHVDILHFYSKTHQHEKLIEHFRNLRSQPIFHAKFVNHLLVYTTVIDGLGEIGKFDEIASLMQDMKNFDVKLDARFYRALLHGAYIYNRIDLFDKFVKIWISDPNVIYQVADIERTARRYLWKGRWLEALDFLEICLNKKIRGIRMHVLKLMLKRVPNINLQETPIIFSKHDFIEIQLPDFQFVSAIVRKAIENK